MTQTALMLLKRDDLDWAASAGLLSMSQVEPLWRALQERRASDVSVRVSPASGTVAVDADVEPVSGRFDLVHVALYGGTLLIMGALGWFATMGIEAWGGPGVLGIATVYGVLFAVVGGHLWRTPDLKVLGGLLVAAAVSMVAPAVYGLQRTLGLWPGIDPGAYRGFFQWVKGGWFAIEVATIVAGAVAVRLVPFSFVTLPIAVTAWFMSMDLTGLLFVAPSSENHAAVSVIVGVSILVVATALRLARRTDLNFWLEVFGLLAFQGGLLVMNSDSGATKFAFLGIQCVLLTLGALWRRPVFIVFGVFGLIAVNGWALFGLDRAASPAMCLGLGLMTVCYGLFAQHRRWWWAAWFPLVLGTAAMTTGPFFVWARHNEEGLLAILALWNIGVVGLGVFLRRPVVTMVGGLALAAWIVHLAARVFADSMIFPIVLVSLGLLVIAAGVFLHRRGTAIDRFFDEALPEDLRKMRPPRDD